jgi:hypothetical protein
MGASQRTKGAAGEREWCDVLEQYGFEDAQRVLGQARDGGGDVAYPPTLYEVKRYHKIAVRKWLDQAKASVIHYKGCEMPVVAMREDGRKDWMVLVSAHDFLTMLRELTMLK